MSEAFFQLTPHHVMEFVEKAGLEPTGEFYQLNSYENRVFDVRLESQERVIAKFYRPGRWSEGALRDEHDFLWELKENDVPAVSPLRVFNGDSLYFANGMWGTLFPRVVGRVPQELFPEDLFRVGRILAQLHNVGARRVAPHRPRLDVEYAGLGPLRVIKQWIPPELWSRYESAAHSVLRVADERLKRAEVIRIHGDCHRGNLLHTDFVDRPKQFYFVDFDDYVNGPPAQDFWMLLSGLDDESADAIYEGYEELRDLDGDPEVLFEPLRALRLMSYASWIATRWNDPSFPKLFPHFGQFNYWAEETEALEQIAWSL